MDTPSLPQKTRLRVPARSIGMLAGLCVLVLMGWYLSNFFRDEEVVVQPRGCTEEALVCPDGSSVVRSGPGCAFAPCPAHSVLTGVLKKSPEQSYVLEVDGSSLGGDRSVYGVPLALSPQTSIDLESFVGTSVQVEGVFAQGNTYILSSVADAPGVETTDEWSDLVPEKPHAPDQTPPPTFEGVQVGTLKIGESVVMQGIEVTLLAIVQDSRCPLDVQCVWAGSLVANVRLTKGTQIDEIHMSTDDDPYLFEGVLVAIDKVDPAARAGTTTAESIPYRITFRVESAK